MKPLSLRVLKIFEEMKQECLDLHVLFEAAGNEPAERERVLDAVEELLGVGVLCLDLHVLFEAAGNEPAERERVLDAVEELLGVGVLENRSGDFYSLTEKGKKAIVEP